MTLALCILAVLGTAAGLWLLLELELPTRVKRDDYTIVDMFHEWRKS